MIVNINSGKSPNFQFPFGLVGTTRPVPTGYGEARKGKPIAHSGLASPFLAPLTACAKATAVAQAS